jgi:hypothetical protein
MTRIEGWPPPDWPEVIILWDNILLNGIYGSFTNWLDNTPGGCYHMHGYNATEGIAIRFEQMADAVLFKLKWS